MGFFDGLNKLLFGEDTAEKKSMVFGLCQEIVSLIQSGTTGND